MASLMVVKEPPAKLLAHGCQVGALSGLGDTVGYGVNIGGGGHGEASCM